MTTIVVVFDSQALSREAFSNITQGGTVLGASGLLNLRWEDFSALDAARELDIMGVTWEATRDDTPGMLTCIIRYDAVTPPGLRQRLLGSSVLEYEMREG